MQKIRKTINCVMVPVLFFTCKVPAQELDAITLPKIPIYINNTLLDGVDNSPFKITQSKKEAFFNIDVIEKNSYYGLPNYQKWALLAFFAYAGHQVGREVGFEHAFASYNDGNKEAVMTYYKYKDGKVVYMETGATKLPK